MGCADIIPGVSGGTIAFITGIYTRLVEGIAFIADSFKPKNLKDLKNNLFKIDYNLFIPLILGIVSAFLLLSNIMHYLLEQKATLTYSFFFGLIVASSYVLYNKLDSMSIPTGTSLVVGILAGLLLIDIGQVNASHSLPILFISGAIAITAMILPGISGAFMLLILNQYEYVLNMIRTLSVTEILVFGLGACAGLLLFSEFLRYLLHEHRNTTMGFLIGLMVGSLRLPATIISQSTSHNFIGIFGFALAGFILVFIGETMVHAND